MLFRSDELVVLLYELVEEVKRYLSSRPGARISSLKDIVEFNRENSEVELKYFGQELFEKALELEGKVSEYRDSRNRNKNWAEKTLNKGFESVDILIGCTYGPAWKSALSEGDNFQSASWITSAPSIAGAPIGTIPMGLVSGLPVGLGFVSKSNQETKLINVMAKAERALDLGVLQPTFLK